MAASWRRPRSPRWVMDILSEYGNGYDGNVCTLDQVSFFTRDEDVVCCCDSGFFSEDCCFGMGSNQTGQIDNGVDCKAKNPFHLIKAIRRRRRLTSNNWVALQFCLNPTKRHDHSQ